MKKKGLLIFLIGMVCTYINATTSPYLTSPRNGNSVSSNQTFSWVSNESINSHELKIYNCNYDVGNNSESLRLDEYKLLNTRDIGNNLAVSGLAIRADNRNPLVTCTSGNNRLNAFGFSMTAASYNWLAAFPEDQDSYGALTHLSNGNYVIAESSQNYIYYIPYVPNSGTFIGYGNTPEYKLNLGAGNGIQGITYNPVNNKIYVAQEKSPITLHEFSAFSAPNFSGNVSLKVPFDMARAASNWNIKSVNGLFHLGQDVALNGTNTAEHMLVLSAESNVVIETDMKGNEISRLNLGSGGAEGTISTALAEASGIAFYSGSLFIITKSDIDRGLKAKMYLFQNSNHKNPKATLSNSIYSKKNISGTSYSDVSNNLFDNDKTYCWEIIGTDNEGNAVKSTTFSFKTGTVVLGCTDDDACNYNPDATQDDGTCKECVWTISSISSPSVGQKFYPGSTINIKWEDNFSENVKIQLISVNDTRTISNSTSSDGTYSYTIPTNIRPATNYRVYIQKVDQSSVNRYSGVFIIEDALYINIYSPTAQSTYTIGNEISVRWEHNLTGTFDVSLYKGSSYIRSIADNTSIQYLDYQLPTTLSAGSDYRFFVKSNSTNVSAYSPYVTFEGIEPPPSVDKPMVTVTEPKQNSVYDVGQDITIRWEDNFDEPVDIFLFKDDRYKKDIAKNVSGTSYLYKFDDLEDANDYTIYIRSTKNANVADYGPNFTLLETGITVTSPYASNKYDAGDYISVRWNDASSTNVSIALYDNNTLLTTIVEKTPNNGAYSFKSPTVNEGNNYTVVVSSFEDSSKNGASGKFEIAPLDGISNINMFSGSLGNNTNYINNDDFFISWRDKVSGEVLIQLFKDGKWISGLTGKTKSDGIEKIVLTGSKLPNGGNYQIKVFSLENRHIYNFSKNFNIVENNGNRYIENENERNIGLLHLYPNPTSGFFSIDIPDYSIDNSEINLSVFNALGHAIFKKNYVEFNDNKIDFNLSNEPKGIYFINLSNSQKTYRAKVLLD